MPQLHQFIIKISNLQLINNAKFRTCNFIEKKNLNKNRDPIINKQPNSYYPHTYITSLILELLLHIMTHINIIVDIGLDNNQYLMDWFKIH